MIDKHINFEAFSDSTAAVHQAGIENSGKTYKQRSHKALVSAFFNIIDRLSVSTLLEIGAFQAEVSRKFVSEAPGRHALAVEANPYNFNKFKDSLSADGVQYHHAAVVDREGPCELQLHVTEIDKKNGYIRGNNSILKSDARTETRAVTVPGTTLDALLAGYVESQLLPDPAANHPVLWIDVEGALDCVIRGGGRTIAKSLMVFAEVETKRLWNDQATFSEIAALLDKLGFFPYLRDCEYEPEQFNVLFVNRSLIKTVILEEVAVQFYDELQSVD